MPSCVECRIARMAAHTTVTRSGAQNIQEKRELFVQLEEETVGRI